MREMGGITDRGVGGDIDGEIKFTRKVVIHHQNSVLKKRNGVLIQGLLQCDLTDVSFACIVSIIESIHCALHCAKLHREFRDDRRLLSDFVLFLLVNLYSRDFVRWAVSWCSDCSLLKGT